ncbi:GAF domain-containing protein [Sneathiella sp. P13V-1]|uniref:ATP-binding protein n=1 Tax=Sneathiella sp. P13V-1 TaxID=2697366 RepID=UPI00187B3FF1|nr:ATP-binding protein [Sneathiella sp. P13V-1]MBE7638408.1 GAF domain-containing protein [Sneathiella sp. P13V-1]
MNKLTKNDAPPTSFGDKEEKISAQLSIIKNFAIDLIYLKEEGELAWYVAREVVEKLGFLDCVVYFFDKQDNCLFQVAAIGEKNPVGNEILNALRIPIGQGITGTVAKTGQPLLVEDLREYENYIPDLTEESLSELCVPLIFEGELLGVIDSEDNRAGFYSNEDLEFLQSVAALTSSRLGMMKKDRALVASQKRTRQVFEAALDGMLTFDSNGIILECNKAAEEILGVSSDVMTNQNVKQFLAPVVNETTDLQDKSWINALIDILGHGIRSERQIHTSDNKVISVEITIVVVELTDEKVYTTFLRDISRQKQVEKERVKALQEAEMASRAKSEFLAIMSHELRTPLNAIIGFSDFLTGQYFGPLGSDKYLDYANSIKTGGQHLLKLVNEILNLSSIEAQEKTYQKEPLNFPEAITDCTTLMMVQAEKKDISFETHIPDGLGQMVADRTAVNQILINLLSNAIKFTQTGGKVELFVSEKEGRHYFTVADNGQGLPNKEVKELLTPFSRGDSNAHRAQEGTGLGLAIVKSLVEAHDGELSFESKSGEGTKVTVSFPSGKATT